MYHDCVRFDLQETEEAEKVTGAICRHWWKLSQKETCSFVGTSIVFLCCNGNHQKVSTVYSTLFMLGE